MRTISRPRSSGFSLIELMVALVIVAILAAVAYPAYTKQMQRGRRADALSALTAVMQAQERYRGNRSSYAGTLTDLQLTTAMTKVAPYYQITLSGVGTPASLASGYVVTATALSTSPQAADVACKTLSVTLEAATPTYKATGDPNNTGTDVDTSAQCWPR